MDLASILLSLSALMLVIVLFLYFQKKKKKGQNEVKLQLDNLGSTHQLAFTQHEFWGEGCAIGLDTSKKVLCFVNNIHNQQDFTLINLAEVENCTVINEHRDVNANRIIDQIRLVFTFKSARSHQSLLFYDREKTLHFTNELMLAEKWKSLIQAT